MARRRLLLLMKPLDMYRFHQPLNLPRIANHKVLKFLDNRRKVHEEATFFCQNILRKKSVEWEPMLRDNLSRPIRNVDLVVTVGGDGTLLHASHFMDDSIPILGLNSDPTQATEVEELSDEFDATRSTGYLCAATVDNFEQVLDNILEDRTSPSNITRMEISINSQQLLTYALNDILVAHPCPSTVSRFLFKIIRRDEDQSCSPIVNCRSSGLRVSTAAGSTAAMLSAGGFAMPILSRDLQYMVREPIISHGDANSDLMHRTIKSGQCMDTTWFCEEGLVYIDGSHVIHHVQLGDTIKISSNAPVLKLFLPQHLLS